jgi:hypothetical protein
VVAEQSLSQNVSISSAGQLMALSKKGNSLIVLISNQLFVTDLPDLTIKKIVPLSRTDCTFRSVAIGPLTNRLFVFGNCAGSINVTVLDPNIESELDRWSVTLPAKYDWAIYQANVSEDEHRLFISYHGSHTTGIDWFDVSSNGLKRCKENDDSNLGCIRVHGGFKLRGDKIFATAGGRLIIETDTDGKSLLAYDTYFENNHVMEFAVNSQGTRLYALGMCGYQDGFSVVNLVDGGVPLNSQSDVPQLSRPAPSPIYKTSQSCGVRIALSHDQLLVVGRTERPVPDPKNKGALLFIDVNDGRVIRTVTTPSEPVDVITDG